MSTSETKNEPSSPKGKRLLVLGLAATPENVLGVLSLIFWSLILVISVKYLVLVLRADNNGEGGIIALTALVSPHRKKQKEEDRYWY